MPAFSPTERNRSRDCVPTFRRPDMLRATLESIAAQQTGVSFRRLIDNDAEPSKA